MERRLAIKCLLVISSGIIGLPSCLNHPPKSSLTLHNFDVSAEQEELLAEIASTIIPQTDTLGAKEVEVHLFVLKMLYDCYSIADQTEFFNGLIQLSFYSKKHYGKVFQNCTSDQRQQILKDIEDKKSETQKLLRFYTIMKAKTIQGYVTSKFVVRDVKKYELIPTVKYNGYFLLENT